jgi:ubiquinone/menaquinone biosynthesis C-methylase UbiE
VLPLTQLGLPVTDFSVLFEHGIWGTPLPQYIKWADEGGIFRVMADHYAVTPNLIAESTEINARGASALLGVLCALQVVDRRPDGCYVMTPVAREYLDTRGAFYVGPALYASLHAPFPQTLRKGYRPPRISYATRECAAARSNRDHERYTFGQREQLSVQHAAGFAPAVVAVQTHTFDGISHLIDLCGGSGVFSIALALFRPAMRVTLVDLPIGLPIIREYIDQYGVNDRVTLMAHNVFQTPWPLPRVDGVLVSNFMHGCDDDECRFLLGEIRRTLVPGGHVLIHEMLWNDDRTGPRITALWNFLLTSGSCGGQRTSSEFSTLLAASGFELTSVVPTAGCFSLLKAVIRR